MQGKFRNILLTGSGGFIGQNLKEYLAGYNLLTPRSYELNLIDTLAVKNYFNENNIDYIIHCGSIGGYRTQKDKDTTLEDNLLMVENLLNFKKQDTKVILFGSGAMYDKSRNLHKVKENEIGSFEPADLYGKSKLLIAEKIKNRNDVVMLNIFGCYGKYEKDSRFPTYTIKQSIKQLPIEINQNVVFDYLYIGDLCKIVDYFIKTSPVKNIINVTPTKSITLVEIAKLVNEITGFNSKIIVKNHIMNNEYTGDNSLLLSIADFKFTSYKDGLKAMYKTMLETCSH